MNEMRNPFPARVATGLRMLMYIAITSLLNSFISYFPFIPGDVTTWISRGIMLAVMLCMFRLSLVNDRYRTAGILRAAMLGCNLITAFLFGSMALTLAASIFSIIAVYQEYAAHAELVADLDRKLAGQWRSLFIWSILAAALLTLGTSIVAMIFVLTDWESGAARISYLVTALLRIPQSIIEIMYILYLRKMADIFSNYA